MKLKSFLVAMASAVVLLGPQASFAWDPNALQRGWVDTVSLGGYPGPIFGPSQTVGLHGWACVRPGWPDYGVPSTSLAVYQGGLPPPYGSGVRVPVLDVRYTVSRNDVVAAGACSNLNNGFSIWVVYNGGPRSYYVEFLGPYGNTLLEGQSYF
jgi:hypothetical protein